MSFKIIPLVLLLSTLTFGGLTLTALAKPSLNTNQIIDYSNRSIITTSGVNLLFVTLDNGFSNYPPSVICINGLPVSEISSGSGQFNSLLLLTPGSNDIWIPYFGGICTPRSTQDSSFGVSLLPNQSVVVNAKIIDKSSGGTTIPTTTNSNNKPKDSTGNNKDTSGGTQQVIQEVVKPEIQQPKTDEPLPEFIAYALKSISISAGKPIPLDAKLVTSKTVLARNRSVKIDLTSVVRLDPKFKDATCEVITSRGATPVANAKLDAGGKCDISWTPGAKFRKGRISAFVRILDSTRNHTYITKSFNLNII
jgi:hypothetical protein